MGCRDVVWNLFTLMLVMKNVQVSEFTMWSRHKVFLQIQETSAE